MNVVTWHSNSTALLVRSWPIHVFIHHTYNTRIHHTYNTHTHNTHTNTTTHTYIIPYLQHLPICPITRTIHGVFTHTHYTIPIAHIHVYTISTTHIHIYTILTTPPPTHTPTHSHPLTHPHTSIPPHTSTIPITHIHIYTIPTKHTHTHTHTNTILTVSHVASSASTNCILQQKSSKKYIAIFQGSVKSANSYTSEYTR